MNLQEKIKILLIQPPKSEKSIGGEDIFLNEPLALEYIGASVNDYEVKILDMRIERNLRKILCNFQPQVVGITAYTVHVNVVKNIFKEIKKINRKILTVVGGHHATVSSCDFLDENIDIIVIGEGVPSFKEIIEKFENNKNFKDIAGIAINYNNQIYFTPKRAHTNLDDLPFPDRSLTSHLRKYYFSEWMRPLASIRTSKGCVYRCNFCALWKLTNGRYLTRNPELIVEELKK